MCSADLMSPPAIVFLPFPFPLEERAASRARFSAASLSSCSFILVSVYDALAMARSPPSSIGLRRRREGGGGGAALLLFGCATGRRRSILLFLGRPLALRRRGAVDRRRLLPGVGVDHGVVGRVVTILLREVDRRQFRLVLAMFIGPRFQQFSDAVRVAPRRGVV